MSRPTQEDDIAMSQLDRYGSEPPTSARALEPFVHEDEVRHYLDLYARAVTAGDLKAIAALWTVPALVLAGYGAQAVTTLAEIEAFFAHAKDHYAARGIVDTRPDIQYVEWLTERIVLTDVRWPLFDANHDERSTELATYTLERNDGGALKMRVAIMRGEAPTEAH